MPILAYDTLPNNITLFAGTQYFPQKRPSHSPDYVPDPVMNPSDFNAYIVFLSMEPGLMNVDYGDGYKEQIVFRKTTTSEYIAGFKSLYSNSYKNGNNGGFGYSLEDGTPFIPNNPHVYTDGRDKHNIVISFTNDIYVLRYQGLRFDSFPILNMPGLKSLNITQNTYDFGGIDEDRIGASTEIEYLQIGENSFGEKWRNWPAGFLKLTKLRSLSVNNDCDFSDLENSNFRQLTVWKNLETANWNACCIPKYVEEFNSLSKLEILYIAPSLYCGSDGINNYPDFSEVEKINPSIKNLYIMGYGTNDVVDNWKEWISGKGLENLTSFWIEGCRGLPFDNIPVYFKEMRSLMTIGAGRCFNTLDKIDSFVNAFYEYITSWDSISMSADASDGGRNQFYGLQIVTYNSGYNEQYRPSGTLQAPSGFVQGQSNGTPTTPMEKIYVLTNNYKQVWTLKPEEATSAAARVLTAATPYSLSIVEDRVYFGTGDMISPGEVFNFQTPEDAKRFLTSFNYPTEVIDEYVKQQNEGGPA